MIISPDSVEFCDSIPSEVYFPNVSLKEDGTYRMYFTARSPREVPAPIILGYIYEGNSQDGLYWNPDSLRPFLAPYMLGENIVGVLQPFYFKDKDGKEYLYFAFVDTTYIPVNVPWPPDYGIRIGRALLSDIVNGDCNGDSTVDIGDIVCLINYVFYGGPPPQPCESGDTNGDGVIDIGDIVVLINYVFYNGPRPSVGCAKTC
jgi:hypothetical protein